MTAVLSLARSTLRTRRAAFAGAFVAIALAVTLVYAMGQVMTAALLSPGPGRFATADAVVTKHASVQFGSGEDAEHVPVAPAPRLSQSEVARIAALPGVDAAIGDLAFPAALGEQTLEGHGWASAALTPFELTAGRAPRAADEVVVDAGLGLRPGQRVRLGTPGGARTFRVAGTARTTVDLPAAAPAVFFEDAVAPTLAAAPGAVNAIAVRGDVGAVRAALGDGYEVLDHDHAVNADAAHPRTEQRFLLIAAMGSGGGIVIMIAVFVVASTLGFAIAQRRREIALLRAVGATPRQIRRLIAGEALLLSLAAAVVGLAAGVPLAAWLGGELRDGGAAPADLVVPHHPIAALVAVATAVVVAQLAVLVAARRASRIAAGEALLEAAVEQRGLGRWRTITGWVSLAGAAALITLSFGASPAVVPAMVVPGALCAAIGLAFLGPVLLARPVMALARLLSVRGGAGWWLAAAEAGASRRRVGAVAAPILLVVALAGTQAFADGTDRAVVREDTQARVQAGAVLTGDVLPTTLAAQARALPGVRAATGVLSTKVYLVGRGISNDMDADVAVGLDGAARSTLDLGVTEGSLRDVRGRNVAISDLVAQRNGGLHIGDVLRARLADTTPVNLRVAAIYRNSFGLGDVVLDRAVAVRHAGPRVDDAVYVDGDREVLAQLAAAQPGVHVVDRSAFLEHVSSGLEDDAWITWIIVGMAAIYATIAVANTLIMAVSQRRPELALVRLAGATPRQALAMIRNEAIATTLVAIAAGGLVALAAGQGIARAYPGGHVALVVPIGVAIVATAALVGIGSATIAGRIALRRPARPGG